MFNPFGLILTLFGRLTDVIFPRPKPQRGSLTPARR